MLDPYREACRVIGVLRASIEATANPKTRIFSPPAHLGFDA
jgi:hypothetical protein